MMSILKMGGFKTGGTNFDAKVRRESFEPGEAIVYDGESAALSTDPERLAALIGVT